MTQFYLIRHGEPQWDVNEQYKLKGHGRDLVPLTAAGAKQVSLAARDERLRDAELIVSSPYTRALQTAAILSKELGLDQALGIQGTAEEPCGEGDRPIFGLPKGDYYRTRYGFSNLGRRRSRNSTCLN